MHNPFMVSVSDYYGSKRFEIGHNNRVHTDDISNPNYKEINE